MRIALANFRGMPAEYADDDERLYDELRAAGADPELIPWDDPEANWDAFALVLIRSTWDYSRRRDEFVSWAEGVGGALHNPPALVRWNSDKRYVADLGEAGIPAVDTEFFAPGDEPPAVTGEVVVKPTVSAGGQSTGRFSPATAEAALALIGSIHAQGKTAMVQPFNPSVDDVGETAVVMFDGKFSHALRKRAVLRADEVAPVRPDAIGVAETMYDPGLVTAGEASPAEIEVAGAVVAEIARRFGSVPLYARVDLLQAADGSPVLLELEAIEPNFYFEHAPPGAAERFARAIVARAGR